MQKSKKYFNTRDSRAVNPVPCWLQVAAEARCRFFRSHSHAANRGGFAIAASRVKRKSQALNLAVEFVAVLRGWAELAPCDGAGAPTRVKGGGRAGSSWQPPHKRASPGLMVLAATP